VTSRATPDPDIRLVTVLHTNEAGTVAIAKSILDCAGIEFFVLGETLQSSVGRETSRRGAFRFQVRAADAADASRALAPLGKSRLTSVPNNGD
jgi:hypothetical protein